MQAYFEQLKTRVLGTPSLESSNDVLELVQRIENGYEESSRKLIATELELKVAKDQSSEFSHYEREVETLRGKLDEVTSQRARYLEVMTGQQNEINRLHEETRSLNQSLDSVTLAKNEALGKICDIESTKFNLECQVSQLEIEVKQLRSQLVWANEQLELRSSELESIRRNSAMEKAQMETELNAKRSELEIAEQIRQSTTKSLQDQQAMIADLTGKLHEAQVNFTTMEQRYTAELQASERRDRLYRDNSEDDRRQLSDVTNRLSELEQLVQSKEARIIQILGECDKIKADAQKVQEERDAKIAALSKELENANSLISAAKRMGIPLENEVEALSPAAVVAGRLAKSGLSITQMYTKFLEVSDACQLKDVELNGLKEILSKVYEELERKGPELKRQREELESTKREVISLREQLEGVNKEKLRLQRVVRDRDEKMIAFERERSNLRLKCGDLSKQVQTLLLRVEIAEGRRPAEDDSLVSSSAMETSFQTSGEFISQKLVTFKDIQELQQQNERLLALIRELSSDKEEEDERKKRVSDLEDELQKARNDFDDLQTAHRHAQELLETITKQRDNLKLITQSPTQVEKTQTASESTMAIAGSSFANATVSTPRPFTISRVTSSSSIVGSPPTANRALNLQKIEEELQFAKRKLSERDADFTKLQGEISALKIQLTEQKACANSSESRAQLSEQRAEAARREVDVVRAKSARQDAICAQLEQTVASMRAEMDTSRTSMKQRESELASARREADQLKSVNVQTAAERDALRRAEQHTTMLLASMESIKRAVSEDSREDRRRSLDRCSELDREVACLRIKLDEEKHRRAELVKQLELELGTVQKQLAAEQESHQRTQNALTAATSALAPDSNSAQADLERRQQAEQLASANTELRLEADEMRRKLALLEEEKRQKDVKQTELNDFSSTLEETLAEQKGISENLARSLRDLKSELEQKCSELDSVRSQLEAARLSAENERDLALEKLDSLQQALQGEISQLRESVSELSSERDGLITEKSKWSLAVGEAESKYNHEVELHAGSIEHLRQARQKVLDFEKKVSAFEREKADMISKLSAADHRVTEMEAQAQAARSEADQYRQQLDALLEKVAVTGPGGETGVPTIESDPSSAELVHFLRRERSLLQSRLDVAETDVSRTRTMLTMAQREASELRATVNEERKQRQAAAALESSPLKGAQAQGAAQKAQAMSAEIERRLESMNSLLDSNRMLREERDRFEAELKQFREKGVHLGAEDAGQLKQKLADLKRQFEVLQAEKQAATSEAERWRQRVQNLMEQMKRSEIDELRKAAAERDTVRQNLTRNLEKMRVLEQELATLKQQLEESKSESQKLRDSDAKNKAEAEESKVQIGKLNETNQQLRKIATKYKQQYLDTDKVLKEKTGGVPIANALPGTSTTETAAPVASSQLQESVAGLEVQLASTKAQLDELQRKLSDAEREKTTALGETLHVKKQLEEASKKQSELVKLVNATRSELREAIQRNQTLNEEFEEAKTAKAELERRYNDLQKQYNELHDMYEALERENRDLAAKLREALRTGSMTPGSSAAAVSLPATSTIQPLGNNHGQTTSTSSTVTTLLPPSTTSASAAEFSPLMDTTGTGGAQAPGSTAAVAVSPAAVVHPRLRSQQTATVAPTNVHAPPSRLAPPAPIPPIRVWPTVRQTTAQPTEPAAASSTATAPTTSTEILPPEITTQLGGQEQQPTSPGGAAGTSFEPLITTQQPTQTDQSGSSSGRTSVQPQKRSRQQASFGTQVVTTQVSPGEGSSVVGSSSDNFGMPSVDSAENETNKRRRLLLQGPNQQSVMPFSSAASSEQLSEDDLLLEGGAGSSQPMMMVQQMDPMVGGEGENEEEEPQQPTIGDDLVGGEGEVGGDLAVDAGQDQVGDEEGFDFETGPGDDHPQQPQPQQRIIPAVSSEIQPNLGEEGDDSGEGGDYSQQSGRDQQKLSESRYEAVDSLDYGDQVVGSSADNELALSGGDQAGTGAMSLGGSGVGGGGGLEAHSAANIDQSEMEDEDDLSAGQGAQETGGEEEEEHIVQQEEGSSSQGFLSGSGQFGSTSGQPTQQEPWTFGQQQSQQQPTGQATGTQQQPQQTTTPQPSQQSQPSQSSQPPRPRIEPIVWDSSPASSTAQSAGALPGPSRRRLTVPASTGSAPNMFFQQTQPAGQPQPTVHANAPIQTMPLEQPLGAPGPGALPPNLQQQQVSPQRMPRPAFPTRARGFGAAPFNRGARGGPRRGI